MAEANYIVRIGWETTPSSAFSLDKSALDGSNILINRYSDSLDVITFGSYVFDSTNTFAGPFDAAYSDVSTLVQEISVRRGRSGNLDQFQAGEAVITLKDTTARYSPLNTSSPIYPNVIPGRSVTIKATLGTVTYPVFRGFVRSIEYDPARTAKHTIIHAQDLLLLLSRARPTITNTGTVTTGQAIGTVLTAVDWTDPSYRDLGTGDTIEVGFANNAESTALELIEGFLETERGEAFHAADGRFVYRDRYSRYKRQTAGTLTNVAAEATAATDLTNIRNRAKVVKTGSGTAVWSDGVSVNRYGASDYTTIDSPYINNAAQGTALAQWIVSQTAAPSPPVRSLRFIANRSDALMAQGLARDIGDRIRVADSAISGTADFYIEGIDHTIHSGGKVHEVTYTMTAVPAAAPIIFGTSSIYPGSRFDGSDVFAF